jgi:hypothetical protein
VTFEANRHGARSISVRVEVGMYVGTGPGEYRVLLLIGSDLEPVYLDENHAQALVLALQAAIAEVQARAVSL